MRKPSVWWGALIAAVGLAFALLWLLGGARGDRSQRLADGSCLTIREAVVSKEVSVTFLHGNPLQQVLGRAVPGRFQSLIPAALRSRCFPNGRSAIRISGKDQICLFLVTDRDHLPKTDRLQVERLVVGDESGQNTYNTACLVTVNNRFQGWAFRGFPSDSKTLLATFLASDPEGHLVEAARFRLKNPANGRFSSKFGRDATASEPVAGGDLLSNTLSASTNAVPPAEHWTVEWGEPASELIVHMAEWQRTGWKELWSSGPLPQSDGTVHRKVELSR